MASSPAGALDNQASSPTPVVLPADLPAHLSASLVADLADGDAAATSALAVAFAAVPDARRRRGRRHELTGLLTIGACACLTGAAAHAADQLLAPIDAGRRVIAIDGKSLRGSAPRATPEQAAAARR